MCNHPINFYRWTIHFLPFENVKAGKLCRRQNVFKDNIALTTVTYNYISRKVAQIGRGRVKLSPPKYCNSSLKK